MSHIKHSHTQKKERDKLTRGVSLCVCPRETGGKAVGMTTRRVARLLKAAQSADATGPVTFAAQKYASDMTHEFGELQDVGVDSPVKQAVRMCNEHKLRYCVSGASGYGEGGR